MTAQSTSRYVARHPEILQGEPIITGTRTYVRAIVELWRLGITPSRRIDSSCCESCNKLNT